MFVKYLKKSNTVLLSDVSTQSYDGCSVFVSMLLNVNATLVKNHTHGTSTLKKSTTILVYCLKCLIRGRNRSLEHTPRFNGPNISSKLIYVIHQCNVRTRWDIHELCNYH